MPMAGQMRIAVDLNGAVVCPTGPGSHFYSGPRALVSSAPELTGAATAIGRLAEAADVWLVARAGEVTAEHLWWWLKDNRFLERTGLHPRQVVIEPPDVDWLTALTPLAPTHLISTDPDVLVDADGHVAHRILLGADCPGAAPGLTVALTWADVAFASVPGSSMPGRRPGRCGLSVVRSA